LPAAIAPPGVVGQHASRARNGGGVDHTQAARGARDGQDRLEQRKHQERQCPPPPAVTGQEADGQYQQGEQHDSHTVDTAGGKRARLTSRRPGACTEYARPGQEELQQDASNEDRRQMAAGDVR
jgi:hypothetical protein